MEEPKENKPTAHWLAAFHRGDRELLKSIYLEQAPRLRRMLRDGFGVLGQSGVAGRFVGIRSPFDLDCAIQDIFCRAFEYKTRDSFDGRVPFATYLGAIARNYAINTLRQREDPHPDAALRSAGEGLDAVERAPSPEHLAMVNELRQVLDDFRSGCSAEEVSVLQARYLESLSQAQTARLIKTTRRRVRTVEASLRKRLVRLLRQHRTHDD